MHRALQEGDIVIPLNTLLDVPVKDKRASDALDPVADSDFELDLRVTLIPSEVLSTPTRVSYCVSYDDSCYATCAQMSCYPCSAYCYQR